MYYSSNSARGWSLFHRAGRAVQIAASPVGIGIRNRNGRERRIAQIYVDSYDLAMPRHIAVHLLPEHCDNDQLAGGVAVVMDVLRATTTIVTALSAGATAVIPCGEIDEARRIAADLPSGTAVLGGERGGVRIAGFDFGNSPFEYTREKLAGRTLVFTTTNGTRALIRARTARRVFVAGFVNLNAVLDVLLREQGDVHLICAGTDGAVTAEDCLCAGALAEGIARRPGDALMTNDGVWLARGLYEAYGQSRRRFDEVLRGSRGGRNLIELGMQSDIETAGRWDVYNAVPELSRHPWEIRLATGVPGGQSDHTARLEAPRD